MTTTKKSAKPEWMRINGFMGNKHIKCFGDIFFGKNIELNKFLYSLIDTIESRSETNAIDTSDVFDVINVCYKYWMKCEKLK